MIAEKQVLLHEAGKVWSTLFDPAGRHDYFDVLRVSSTGIIRFGIDGTIFESDNNGSTFRNITSVYSGGRLRDFCVMPDGTYIMAGSVYSGGGAKTNLSRYKGAGITQTGEGLGINAAVLYVTPIYRILVGSYNTNGIWYSDDNGETWTQSNKTDGSWSVFCVTPTGRLIAGSSNGYGIWYSDDNGVNWTQSNKTNGSFLSLCVTSTGRIVAGNGSSGIYYSDNNGVNWMQSSKTTGICGDICITNTGRILLLARNNNQTYNSIWYSDDNGVNWEIFTTITNISPLSLAIINSRILTAVVEPGPVLKYSDAVMGTQKFYTSKPLTGAQAKQLIAECKAYVQSLKS